MKFGFSKLVGSFLLGLIMVSGCSRANRQPSKAQSTSQSSQKLASSSKHAKPAQVKPKATSKTNLNQRNIRSVEKKCLTAASGQTSIYVDSLNTKQPVIMNNRSQRSASVIKLFIMVEAFRQIKAGRLALNQEVSIPQADRVGGTGELAHQSVRQLSVSRLLTLMIRNSDNSATNVLIDRLGGLTVINQEIKRLGCTQTRLQRKMLDYQALKNGKDNMTSVKDVGSLLSRLYQHRVLGDPYDTKMLQLLRYNANQSKLPALINQKATIFNKTGEFPDYGVQNDAAILLKRAIKHLSSWFFLKRVFKVGKLTQCNSLAVNYIRLFSLQNSQLKF
ncbi:serine hydrolase [Secundilactobacillus hailunensis]|uniref:Serine hydrolase n=1 Tax=Secundilactobacillus hailunensis TaxID=2559923 RepID=A0ABW1T7M6_9LACO|nr:serine hydrolase [Secundilactobacillus hailunensis]